MTDNIIKQPLLPNTIHFNHTRDNAKTEVMRITREGVWVNPDMQVDETAKAVLDALSSQVKVLVQRAVEDEREACAKVCDAESKRARWNWDNDISWNQPFWNGGEQLASSCASFIRARGNDKPAVKSYCGGKPNYCTPEVTGEVTGDVDSVDTSQESVDETAKGEHEPIGYIDGMHGGYMVFTPINPSAVYLNGTALYTAPPKKEWVGLTDADKQEAFDETQEASGGFWEFADYLETKLKEKNT